MKKSAFLPVISFAKIGMLTLFGLFLITACNDDKKQVEALTKETEAVHDDAMKDMAEMNRVARELKATMIAAIMTPEQSAVYESVLTQIGNAENNMMEWMKNYKSPENAPAAEAIKYLQEQKAAIQKNQAEIKAALEAGKQLQSK